MTVSPLQDAATSEHRPEACPFCGSKAVGTLAKVISPSTYWRCAACGETWNPQRLAATRRPSGRSSW